MTEHEGKNKTSQNKNKKEIRLTQEFIGFFFPSSVLVEGTCKTRLVPIYVTSPFL